MKKYIRNIVAGVLLLSLLLPSVAFAAKDVQVAIDGMYLDFDVPPQIIDGRTMVPLRVIFTALGAEVDWDDSTKTVTAMKDDITVTATIGSKTIYIDGKAEQMDVAPVILDGRTLVPARFVAQAFDCLVDWDERRYTVHITTDAVEENVYMGDE